MKVPAVEIKRNSNLSNLRAILTKMEVRNFIFLYDDGEEEVD